MAVNLGGVGFRFPKSRTALEATLPVFFNDLKFVGRENQELIDKLTKAMVVCVQKGEEKFDMAFGGWSPESNEFGVGTLRPQHVDHPTATNNRWYWTSSATASVHTLADTWINATLASNELVMVYGYFNLEAVPNTIEMQAVLGANTLAAQNIQPMRAKEDQYIIFPEPWIIEPYSVLKVNCSCITTSTAEEMGLLGYLFAPNSVLITA